jgi:hypothetical protein
MARAVTVTAAAMLDNHYIYHVIAAPAKSKKRGAAKLILSVCIFGLSVITRARWLYVPSWRDASPRKT